MFNKPHYIVEWRVHTVKYKFILWTRRTFYTMFTTQFKGGALNSSKRTFLFSLISFLQSELLMTSFRFLGIFLKLYSFASFNLICSFLEVLLFLLIQSFFQNHFWSFSSKNHKLKSSLRFCSFHVLVCVNRSGTTFYFKKVTDFVCLTNWILTEYLLNQ